MKIETKFNIGDEVYYLFKNKIISSKISFIKINIALEKEINIIYGIEESYFRTDPNVQKMVVSYGNYKYYKTFSESILFRTKQELINSL